MNKESNLEDEGVGKLSESKSPKESVIKKLTEDNEKLKHTLKEERFFTLFVAIILFDSWLFTYVVDGLAALTIGILQIILLMLIADKLDIKYIEVAFKRITGMLKKE